MITDDCRTMESFEILCGIAVIIIISVYLYYLTSTFDFWKSRGVRGPHPISGPLNFKDVIFTKISIGDFMTEVYNAYKDEPMIGIFIWTTPVLIVKDLDLIRDILIKDFSIFANRGIPTFKKADPLSQHLFSLEPKRWRPLRTKLSPIFTSYKLKEMFSLISECSDHLVKYMEEIATKNEPVECHELTAKYTINVIGTCVFGIKMNAMSNDDSEFRKMGRQVFETNWKNLLKNRLKMLVPWLYEMFGYILPQSKITKFFIRIVVDTINYREKNSITRNDFIDILRELKKHPEKLGDIELTDELLSAQAFIFFAAGFESSSRTISNALYELALNQKIQDNLREEIDDIYTKLRGELTYNIIKKMDYLDKIFKETLRKYPPVTVLVRQATSSYTFNGTQINIPKGLVIFIPNYAIHRDSDIYPKPDVFDPERFNEKAVQNRHSEAYIPFGNGPRSCIGSRFAIYQIKVGLIKILRHYKVETCEKTPIPYINDPKSIFLVPKGGLHLKMIKINRSYN